MPTYQGKEVILSGKLPTVGGLAPNFSLVRKDLSVVSLGDFSEEFIVLNVFISLDTPICAASVMHFASLFNKKQGVKVLDISMDLPFAMRRFCQERSLEEEVLSAFRSSFGKDYGVTIEQGPLKGLLSRSIFILDRDRKILYSELVTEIAQEPNYKALAAALGVPSS